MNAATVSSLPKASTRVTTFVTAATAIILAMAATAWACTPADHGFDVTPKSINDTSNSVLSVTGHCSGHATNCPISSNRNIFIEPGTDPGTETQSICTTSSTALFASTSGSTLATTTNPGPTFSGNGVVRSGVTSPGPYLVCAGINTSKLYEGFTVT